MAREGFIDDQWAAVSKAVQIGKICRTATTQHSTAQHSTTQHNTTRHSTAQHSKAQHGTAQHGTAQHNTAQHSTTQHGTAQHGTAQHSTAHNTATRRNGTPQKKKNVCAKREQKKKRCVERIWIRNTPDRGMKSKDKKRDTLTKEERHQSGSAGPQ